jgi:hypothetical protein
MRRHGLDPKLVPAAGVEKPPPRWWQAPAPGGEVAGVMRDGEVQTMIAVKGEGEHSGDGEAGEQVGGIDEPEPQPARNSRPRKA